ncbi:tetratricopeptide repeat protein [Rhodobacteraceae bacterium NNCM2]|nr:tetratricopeptide repeat protein [Coraliihabitans acroporae]
MHRETSETGLTYTVSQHGSAEAFEDVVSAYLCFSRETGPKAKALSESDPDMPMALCLMGYLQKLFGSASMSTKARESEAALKALMARVEATDREKMHAAALSAWCEGQLEDSCVLWEKILLDHPHDALALRLAHFLHFYSGDGRRMRDSVARVLPNWQKGDRNYGFLLGMYAFGHEESRDYATAERFGREAVEINPEDGWSVHAVAHVLEMQERHAEGIEWVQGLEQSWSKGNNFRFHIVWHRSLYHLERGEYDVVLKLYDDQIVSDIGSEFYLDICNACSMLWRLEMHGVDVGDRWLKLAEISRHHTEDQDLIFVTLHYLMALVSTGDKDGTAAMMKTIQKWSGDGSTQGQITADSGLAIARAMGEIRAGDYASAARRLIDVRYRMDRIGGSLAQRDVFEMLMLDASEKAGDAALARALYADRTARRPRNRWTWSRYADTLDRSGDAAKAAEARARMAQVAAE